MLGKVGLIKTAGEVLKDAPIKEIFDTITSLVDCRMGLHDLAGLHSDKMDEMILREEANKNEYVGGEFSIVFINDAYMELSYELYFKNPSGQYIKKESKSHPIKTSYLDDDAIKVINEQEDKKISFEIDPPAKKVDVRL